MDSTSGTLYAAKRRYVRFLDAFSSEISCEFSIFPRRTRSPAREKKFRTRGEHLI